LSKELVQYRIFFAESPGYFQPASALEESRMNRNPGMDADKLYLQLSDRNQETSDHENSITKYCQK